MSFGYTSSSYCFAQRCRHLALFCIVLALAAGSFSSFVHGNIANDENRDASSQNASAPPAFMTQGVVQRPSGANVAVIPVTGMIDHFTMKSMERRIQRAIDAGASVLVFELDTPGGLLDAAMGISKFIKNLTNVITIAWVNPEAYSAGILIASACDEIIMSGASATGDCAPINLLQGNMGAEERAKVLSPLLAEFRDNAMRNGYDYATFHAMCVLGIELYLIEHIQTGERKIVNQVDYDIMVEGADPAQFRRYTTSPSGDLSLQEQEDRVARAARDVALAEDIGQWRAVDVTQSGWRLPDGRVHDGQTLFTVNQTHAKDIGLSKETVSGLAELEQYLQAGQVVVVMQSWSESLAAFLSNIWVRGVLLVLLVVCGYMELSSPGLGLPGIVAVMALVALLGAPYLAGLAEVWHIIFFMVGLVLLFIEVTVLPSFGILGVVGLGMMFVGLVLSVIPVTDQSPAFGPVRLPAPMMWNQVMLASLSLLLAMGVALVTMIVLAKNFGRMPMFDKLILRNDSPSDPFYAVLAEAAEEQDMQASQASSHVSGDEVLGAGHIEVGMKGKAITPLRPAGMAEIGGYKVDVISSGEMIATGQQVNVIEVAGSRIVVQSA